MSAAEYSNSPTAAPEGATTEAAGGTSALGSFFSHITPFNYFLFLLLCLLIFMGYLILPMGLRAQYFGAGRRRYRRRRRGHPTGGRNSQSRLMPQSTIRRGKKSLPPEDILENIYAHSHSFSPQEHVDRLLGESALASPTSSYPRSDVHSYSRASSVVDSVWGSIVDNSKPHTSETGTEKQQSQPTLPGVLRELLMQPPGIKFIAHGTKCKPRPVWITLHYDTQSTQSKTPSEYQNRLTWRAELKPPSKSSSPMTTPTATEMPKLGNLRKVELAEVLGIELGKRTTALRRMQTAKGAHENTCFSLLTKTGTLDLECSADLASNGSNRSGKPPSAEEVRAAFITCLALAMSSKGLQLNGLRQTMNSPASSSLHSQLQALGGGSVMSPLSGQWDEQSLFSGLMSDPKTISTVSF